MTWKLAVANKVVVKKKNIQNTILIEKSAQTVPSAIQMPSFKLKLVKATKADEAINHVWIKKNKQNPSKQDLNMMTIMNLVRESKKKGINQSMIWKTLLQHRWDIEILKTNPCLNENQVAQMIIIK